VRLCPQSIRDAAEQSNNGDSGQRTTAKPPRKREHHRIELAAHRIA
jgi:hypothetical protein